MSALGSYFVDLAYSLTNCFWCFPSSPNLKINNRSFKILRLLGEGGFSYVYLVQEASNPANLHALKKIRCPFGEESVSLALREVEAYSLFTPHPNIIHAVDHAVVSDKKDATQKTVYIVLPYFARGNLQDVINANLVNRTRLSERRLMVLLLGVCKGLKAMHNYKVGMTGRGREGVTEAKKVKGQADKADEEMERAAQDEADEEDDALNSGEVSANSSRRRRRRDGDIENEPLMEDEISASQQGVEKGQVRAYAHRDVKPGNIMIAPDGRTPILMDLGSLAPSPVKITSRSHALQVQDTAAEQSTLPYRAPELFDVRVGANIDTKVDIWSIGCTVYACLVGKSPFERRSEETGGSLTMCVLGGDWRFPDEGRGGGPGSSKAAGKRRESGAGRTGEPEPGEDMKLDEGVKDVVRRCLKVEPAERPDVDELMGIVEGVIKGLPDEDGDEADAGVGSSGAGGGIGGAYVDAPHGEA